MTKEIKNDKRIAMMDYGIIYLWQEDGKQFWQNEGSQNPPRHILMTDESDKPEWAKTDWGDLYDVLSAIHEVDENVGDPWDYTWFEL